MQETVPVDSCLVILVNNQTISRNGFLYELTCILVISLGTRFGLFFFFTETVIDYINGVD
jgi:hypothetical protein